MPAKIQTHSTQKAITPEQVEHFVSCADLLLMPNEEKERYYFNNAQHYKLGASSRCSWTSHVTIQVDVFGTGNVIQRCFQLFVFYFLTFVFGQETVHPPSMALVSI